MFLDLNALGPAFVVVEEPQYSRERLLAFQSTFNIHTAVLFKCLKEYGVLPIDISERDLAFWEHFYEVYLDTGGDLLELTEPMKEGACPLSFFLRS